MGLFKLLAMTFTQIHHRLHIDLVECAQDGSILLRLQQALGNPRTQASHWHPLLWSPAQLNDIAIGLRTPNAEAEKIKHAHGCAYSSLIKHDDTIEISTVGGRNTLKVSRQILSEIIEARIREMFEMLNHEIQTSGFQDSISSGIVITGGSACVEGMADLAEEVFQVPVSIGTPMGLGGLVDVVTNPIYATSTGLIHYGEKSCKSGRTMDLQGRNMFDKIFSRMKGWTEEFF